MRPSIPISFVTIPTVCAFGLLLYSIFSDKWITSDFDRVEPVGVEDSLGQIPAGLMVVQKRMPFMKRFGLFRKCIIYKWLNVMNLNSTVAEIERKTLRKNCMRACRSGEIRCGQCCVNVDRRCDHIPECESLDDEIQCPRLFDDPVWLDERQRCFKHRIDIIHLSRNYDELESSLDSPLPASTTTSEDKIHFLNDEFSQYYPSYHQPDSTKASEHYLHGIMAWLMISACLVQLVVLILLALVKPCQKHMTVPFTFITCVCLLGFLSGAVSIGIFLWNWIHRKINVISFHHHDFPGAQINSYSEKVIVYRLNPWLKNIEHLDISLYIACAAVVLCLVETILAFMFYCGMTASRMSFQKDKGSYEVVKVLPPYEDHYLKT